jgi:hypothetical protein
MAALLQVFLCITARASPARELDLTDDDDDAAHQAMFAIRQLVLLVSWRIDQTTNCLSGSRCKLLQQ